MSFWTVASKNCEALVPKVVVAGETMMEMTVTVNSAPLLGTPPTVTITLPVVALVGTGTTMPLLLQLVGVASVPLNVTVLVPCVVPKPVPVIVTDVPADPELGDTLAILGAITGTMKAMPLLA